MLSVTLAGSSGAGKFQILLLGDTWFEAAAAAGLIHAGGANDDQVFTFKEALGVFGRIAAAHTDCEGFGDGFGQSQELGDGWEWPAKVVRIEAGNQNLFAAVG